MRKALAALALTVALAGCSNVERAKMRTESEYNYGVMRTVTAYSSTGKQIGQWHGKIDVEYVTDSNDGNENGRVDVVVFDGTKAVDRIIISGAIVVVDDD
jgi:hypothetical protein